jgi:hypothetical protein
VNWADAYERISGALKDERAAHKRTAAALDGLTKELTVMLEHLQADEDGVTDNDLLVQDLERFVADARETRKPTTPATAGSTPRE